MQSFVDTAEVAPPRRLSTRHRMGAKVCGPPAYDRQFGTTDYFVLARTRDIVARCGRSFHG